MMPASASATPFSVACACTRSSATFARSFVLPDELQNRPRIGFFPGSTIGNFQPVEAVDLLAHHAQRPSGAGALGSSLASTCARSWRRCLPAYNDAAGVTAAFNKNLLVRANRELGADFDLDGFAHEAIFNPDKSRIEMHLVSRQAQTVSLLGQRFAFRTGETIHTENSHKYSVADIPASLAGTRGLVAAPCLDRCEAAYSACTS